MKFYASKVMTNEGTGLPEVTMQIEIGVPLTNYYEMKSVCDTDGNMYYSYGRTLGKISNAGVVSTPIDITASPISLTLNEIYSLAIHGEYLYFMSNSTYLGTAFRILRVPLATFTKESCEVYYSDGATQNFGANYMQIDNAGDIWYSGQNGYLCRIRGGVLAKTSIQNYMIGILDHNKNCWVWEQDNLTAIFRRVYENPSDPTAIISTNIGGTLARNYIIDGLCDKDGHIVILKNRIADDINACTLTKINVSNVVTPVLTNEISLTYGGSNLTQCFNLHTNQAGDLFFSTYGATSGYNTYKVTSNVDFTMNAPVMYFAGLGSKTTGNDPYAFYLSASGHTGHN